jgi:chromosome segregation ATPase
VHHSGGIFIWLLSSRLICTHTDQIIHISCPLTAPFPRTTHLTSAPIRKSGSLFGLDDFTTQKIVSTVNDNSDSGSKTGKSTKGNIRLDGQEEKIVTVTSNDNSTVTVLKKKPSTDDNTAFSSWGEIDTMMSDSEEDDVEEIANSLLLSKPTASVSTAEEDDASLREGSGRESINGEAGTEDSVVSLTGEISIREKLKRDAAAAAAAAAGKILPETTKDATVTSAMDARDEIVLESRPLAPTRPIHRAVLSPTHSIQDDYEKLGIGNSVEIENAADDDDEEKWSLSDNELTISQDVEVDNDVSVSAVATKLSGVSNLQTTEVDGMVVVRSKSSSEQSSSEKDTPNAPRETSSTDTSLLDAVLSTATTFFSPNPPLSPPTVTSIVNSNTAASNLEEINAQLSKTSQAQREDLGRLRRKVNELERELIRAKRDKITEMEVEIDTRAESVRKQCEEQIAVANAAVSRLEKEVDRFKTDLAVANMRLMETEETKERVAAEYGFVTKAYIDVKHALDSQKSQWDQKIKSLDDELADATLQLERYQKEAQRWKAECSNKANALESSTVRISQMQSAIDDLQAVLKTKEDDIKQLAASGAKELERKLSAAKREMREEYEELLTKKSRKIGEVRMALRTANERRKRVESIAQRDTAEALNELHTQMTGEIDALNDLLRERETEVIELKQKIEAAEIIVEDKERLLAELMFLAKSVETMQVNLTTAVHQYHDLEHAYKEETSSLRQELADKADEIEGLVQVSNANKAKVSLLESQVDLLNADLKKQQSFNAGNEMELNDLVSDLDRAEKHANELNRQIDLLKQESKMYEAKVNDLQAQVRQLENERLSLERTLLEEKKGSVSAIDDAATNIAILEQELAEKINEIDTLNKTVLNANAKVDELINQYTVEKKRADDLEASMQQMKQNMTSTDQITESSDKVSDALEVYKRKIDALTQRNIFSQQILNKKLDEIALLKANIDKMSSHSNVEISESTSHESNQVQVIAELKSQIEQLSATSREDQSKAKEKLLLQNQTLAEQKQTIDSLTLQIKKMEELGTLTVQLKANEQLANDLEVQLESTKNDFSTWKAKANEKILNANSILKGKDENIQRLQHEIDALIKNQTDASQHTSEAKEDVSKAKEKIRQKNQIIEERDDAIAQLYTQLNDLQFEKEKVEQTLQAEKQRNEDFYHSHEMQIQATEDKLNRNHAAAMKVLEDETNETVYALQMKIKTLENEIAEKDNAFSSPLVNRQEVAESSKIKELEEALQQSKKKEVDLINNNMRMKNQIENLEAQKKLLVMSASDAAVKQKREAEAVELPSYYKEGKRARLKSVIGNAWRRIMRR